MKLERVLPFSRTLLKKAVQPGDIAVDATIGNGHDTLLLAELVGEDGKVYGFDIQEEALIHTQERLKEHKLLDRVELFQKGHEEVQAVIPSIYHGKVTAAIFNLGYLPGGDKAVVTRPETTISAIQQLIELLAPEGMIVLVIYHGHEEGALERDELLQFVQKLDQQQVHVLQYRFLNQQNNPPFIVAIEKR